MHLRTGRLKLPPAGQIVFLSDIHRDSPTFNQKAWEADKEMILSLPDPKILLNGDQLTMILFNDRRFRGTTGETYHQDSINFSKDLMRRSLKDLWPYVVGVGRGNHETSVQVHNGFDLVHDVLTAVNTEEKRQIWDLGYTGYIELNFTYPNSSDHWISRVLYYHHGRGGGAVVTGGAIDLYRLNAQHRADYHWIGHIHKDITRAFNVVDYDYRKHRPVEKRVQGFVTPGYDGGLDVTKMSGVYSSDWATEKIYGLQPHGFAYLDYEVIRKRYGKNGNQSKFFLKEELRRPYISEA